MKIKNTKVNRRKLLHSRDLIIILCLLIIAFLIFSLFYHEYDHTGTAQITYEGKVVKTVDLNTAQNGIFTLVENKNVSFEIKEKQIRFIHVNCPDKLCENVGFINHSNETAICMPNKTILTILDNEEDNTPDIIVQ